MGVIYSVTCRNKSCRYHVELKSGPGMKMCANMCNLEDQIKQERNAPNTVLELLDNGYHLDCATSYICPTCQEWLNDFTPYIFETLICSPYGTVRKYKLHYIGENPKCPKCNTELIHIQNVLSGKNKCPKCGSENLRAKLWGYYD